MASAGEQTRLQIGHVLFIDIVGYSKLLVNEQSELLRELNQLVSGTHEFREAETEGKLIRLPTGDGMALVFRTDPEAPAQCALEIARALKEHPRIALRMGIHSGPISEVADVNQRQNIAGAGINMAQRVMDCGDAGHILVSKHVAEDLEQHDRWRSLLHDLGSCEVKHGVRIDISNLYSDEVGNSQLPKKLQALKKHRRHVRWAEVAIALLVLAAILYIVRRSSHSLLSAVEKSIAVLPMVNSTGDPANEYFSDGMSEEFIASLSRLSELKVIGRISSFQFKGKANDSKTIGEKLDVRYLLTGSVRKSADRVRIAVELVKSADGATVWSETYDRELKDIFAVQSEIAGEVARQLQVTLLGKNAQIAQLPTAATPSNQNVDAYNALLQGNFYSEHRTAEDFRKAIGFYEQAIRLDPRYALAYAKLSITAGNLANNFTGLATKEGQENLTKARVAAETALSLDPNLSEAHLAQGGILRLFDFDFTGAEAQYRRAFELAPRNPGATQNLATVMSIIGRFDEAVALTKQALALDPLRSGAQVNLGLQLAALGRYDEAEAALRKAIALQPQAGQNYMHLARTKILQGNPAAALELAKKETDPFFRTYALAVACFADGDRDQADVQLKKLIDENADDSGFQIATVYALRKEPDKVFEWLDHAWTTHDPGVSELLVDPFLRACKDDPRFIAFAQKVGVMPKAALAPKTAQ